jgi:hypothetical protein
MYPELGFEAGVKAMLDAQINYDEVETAVACYCYVRVKDPFILSYFEALR